MMVFVQAAAYWASANLLAPQTATCGFKAKILNEVLSEVPIKSPLNPAPMLNPTFMSHDHEAPEPVICFSWRMGFAKFRSVKYNFDLYNLYFDFSRKKWPNFVRFQNPRKK
jgi:hypothetical protein